MASAFAVLRLWEAECARPYEYGSGDCFMLGCRFADRLAGRSMENAFRRAYSTLTGAQRALRRRGYASLIAFFDDRFVRIGPAQARPGDLGIAVMPENGRAAEHVAVCLGREWGCKTATGKLFLPAARIAAAWRNA